jgi:hypothetical protein
MSTSATAGDPGGVLLEGRNSSIRIYRPGKRVAVIVLTGNDVGEHGSAPFLELSRDVEEGPFELFIDARDSRGVTLDVSGSWARWLSENKSSLRRVNMLTGSRFVELTANFVRDFADLGDLMRIYADAEAFDAALAQATHNSGIRLRLRT